MVLQFRSHERMLFCISFRYIGYRIVLMIKAKRSFFRLLQNNQIKVNALTTKPTNNNCCCFKILVDSEQEDRHECFVFISDKLAEEITLTIGQAFELAYRRFLETSGKDLESQRRAMIVQQKIKRLEQENNIYKQRLLELSQFVGIKPELDNYLRRNDIKSVLELPASSTSISSTSSDVSTKTNSTQMNGSSHKLLDLLSENTNGNGW